MKDQEITGQRLAKLIQVFRNHGLDGQKAQAMADMIVGIVAKNASVSHASALKNKS